MDLRQFFTNQTWWGKLIGAFFGYLVAGPAGALFGILIGNFFDQGLHDHLSKPLWYYHIEKNKAVKAIFFEATFSVMGHIAKADGRVSEQAIRMAEELMNDMQLSYKQKKAAQHLFNDGKHSQFKLKPILLALQNATYTNPQLLKLFIDTQYRLLKTEGISERKSRIMNEILYHMHFAPLHQQDHFSSDFTDYSTYHHYQQNRQHSSSRQESPREAPRNTPMNPYTVLEITPSATKQEVKRAYRRLMSRNHPDKLIAQGLPEHRIKAANEKTQQIRKAYEQICSAKGW